MQFETRMSFSRHAEVQNMCIAIRMRSYIAIEQKASNCAYNVCIWNEIITIACKSWMRKWLYIEDTNANSSQNYCALVIADATVL